MTHQVESILRNLQGAVAARQLYAADHPRFTGTIGQLLAEIQAFTRDHGELAVFQIDHRLVFDGAPLPSAEAVARGVFATLAAHGYHRLAFRPGLSREELLQFVGALVAAARTSEAGPLRSSTHVRLAALDATAATGEAAVAALGALDHAALLDAWHGVADHHRLDLDALDVVVLQLLSEISQPATPVTLTTASELAEYQVAHVTNVSTLAMALATALDLPAPVVRQVGLATLLHDVGTIRIPPQLLNAQGQLGEQERALIRRHPVDGARMLLATPGVPDLAVAVAFEHHLHVDGGGYPPVPAGWRMNLASAIAHVCDVYDALRSDRPYRPALPPDRIEAMMRADAGTVFDGRLLEVFFESVVPRTAVASSPTTA